MTRLNISSRLLATAALGGLMLAAVPAAAQENTATAPVTTAAKPEIGDFGFDLTGMDKSVQPGDDFYAFANGTWAKNTQIPADKSNYGMFTALADAGEQFDVVLAMEVVEHVTDVPLFVRRCAEMVKPGGLMIAATLNRTLKSFALAIVGAEYVLRWLPRGTHRWDKFVTPNELEIAMEQAGLRVVDERGVIYNILADAWQLSTDTDVNYLMTAERGG